MGPIAKPIDIPPGLIDELVPSLAAMVDDVVEEFERFGLRASCRAGTASRFPAD